MPHNIYAGEKRLNSGNGFPDVLLKLVGNNAVVTKNGKRMLKIAIKPWKIFKDKDVKDGAVLVANCLVVARGLTYIKGDNPDGAPALAQSIEVYTLNGKHRLYPGGLFYGHEFSTPSGTWGIIIYNGLCGAEGDFCGYHIVKSDGSLKSYPLTNPLNFSNASIPGFTTSEEKFIIPIDPPNMPNGKSLVIKPDGSQRIESTSNENTPTNSPN